MNRQDNFDELQRLLALKRREQPPDDFFHGFPEQVRDRLHDPAPARPLSWSERYGFDSPFRPVWLCGLGVLLCGLLAFGAISTQWIRDDDQFKARDLRKASSPLPGQAEGALPAGAGTGEIKRPMEPVSSSTAPSFERWNLGTPTRNSNAPVPELKR